MKTLMVTPFPPHRDGIAAYAVQELRRLRTEGSANGEVVEVLSPVPSAARWHLKLGTPTAIAQLAKKASAFDRTVVQFSPEMLFGGCRSAAQRVGVWLGLAALARCTAVEYRIHEIEYGPMENNPLERRAASMAFGAATRVTVHTEAERVELDRLTGLGRRVEVIDHGRDFRPTVVRSRNKARAELKLPTDQFVFVAIGFLQHHKGFDRAVEAMGHLNVALKTAATRPNVHLHIVGSARVDHPEINDYVEQLSRQCERLQNVTLHKRFVADTEFDLWLQAADTVIVPYREIWSSGVVERARLFDRQLIASDLPQLRDQTPTDTIFFATVDELAAAMEQLCVAWDRVNGPVARSGDRQEGEAGGDAVIGQVGAGERSPSPELETDEKWTISLDRPDRLAIEAQVIARARAAELGTISIVESPAQSRAAHQPQNRAVDELLALGHLHRPTPTSARPGVAPVKRAITRLIDWQIEPIATRLIDLQRATTQAIAQLDQIQAQTESETRSTEQQTDQQLTEVEPGLAASESIDGVL
ncbi:MAG: glycosyltransferase [Acidimicrobiales bacterium]